MVNLASLAAILIYLLPIAAFLAARSRRDRELWEVALDIPLAVSIDLLLVILLAKIAPLQTAALASRAVWVAATAGVIIARRRQGGPPIAWPSCLGRRELWVAALAAAAAVTLSLTLSRPYSIWDRNWHTPLVSSIRGQSIPFMNVYEPTGTLYYHFSGNVLAALFPIFSLSTLHSSFGLTLAHDVMFGLTGITLALLLRAWGTRRALLIVAAVLAFLLAGPPTALRAGEARPEGGYSYLNYLVMSFRPHVHLAGLLIVGFMGAILVRLRRRGPPLPLGKTAPALIGTTALLAITDEASIGVLGLALGVAWLVEPDVISPSRPRGIAVFLALGAALAVPNILFYASLSPGAHRLGVEIVPWRSPGYHNPPLLLSTEAGQLNLLLDFLPMLAALAAGLLRLWRQRDRAIVGTVVFFAALLAVSALLLTRIEVDNSAYETHRFMTSITLVGPLLGLAWIGRFYADEAPPSRPYALGTALVIGTIAICSVSTIEWIPSVAPKKGHRHAMFDPKRNLYTVDCRSEVGATLSDTPRPTYISQSIWFLYAGCRPVFAPTKNTGHWTLKVGMPQYGQASLNDLHRDMVAQGEPLDAVCPSARGEATADPICAYALEQSACRPAGARAMVCSLSPAQRAELLARPPPPAPAPAVKGR